MHVNAQKDAHEEGPDSAVGLSVVLREIQRSHLLAEAHKGTRQKAVLELDMEKGASQMPTESVSKSKGKFGVPLLISSVTTLLRATAGLLRLQIPWAPPPRVPGKYDGCVHLR